jgi:hypothetical protein
MKNKQRILIIAVVMMLYLVVCAVWANFSKEVGWKGGQQLSAGSMHESKRRGCFVEPLTFHPSKIEIESINVQIEEVWIEQQHNISSIIVIIPGILEYPIFKNRAGYNINFRFTNGVIPDRFMEWMFIVEGEGRGFAVHSIREEDESKGHFSNTIDSNKWKSITVLLTTNWKFTDAKKFTVSKKAQQ